MYFNNNMVRAYTLGGWGHIMEQESINARIRIDPNGKSDYWHKMLSRWIRRGFADRLTGQTGATFQAIMMANGARYVAHMSQGGQLVVSFRDSEYATTFINSLPDTIALGKLIHAADEGYNRYHTSYYAPPLVRMSAPDGVNSELGKLFMEVCKIKTAEAGVLVSDSFERWVTIANDEACTVILNILTHSKPAAHARRILAPVPHPLPGESFGHVMDDLNKGAVYDYHLKSSEKTGKVRCSHWDVYEVGGRNNA